MSKNSYISTPNYPSILKFWGKGENEFKAICNKKIEESTLEKSDVRQVHTLTFLYILLDEIERDLYFKNRSEVYDIQDHSTIENYLKISAEARKLKDQIFND